MKIQHQQIHQQLPAQILIDLTLARGEGTLSDTLALCINTGTFTGRSPLDKFTVDDPEISELVDWSSDFNNPMPLSCYRRLKADLLTYLESREELFSRICYAGAHPSYRVRINVVNEMPSGNLFAYNMFIRPEEIEEPDTVISDWTVLQAPGFMADQNLHGTRSSNFSVISFKDKTILIGGTGYTGEIKKGIFTVLNLIMPAEHNVLSMHCSANVGKDGDTALFFGLSGTGKTTLSTDPQRALIGDDEHGWSADTVFNFEGGCYAKTIGLDQDHEPEIFSAIRPGALVENVVFFPDTNLINFHDYTVTENTRVSYPIAFINNIAKPSLGGKPQTVFFLTCDATGVLPPISKLTNEQAEYFFLSGYTSKIAGTETGVTEPKPTFSTCFGAPFLPLSPSVYAEMLGNKLRSQQIDVWLVNTGWSGKPYQEGKRISLKYTRAMITAALNHSLAEVNFKTFPAFNLQVPESCPGVPSELLDPFSKYVKNVKYMVRLNVLAQMFQDNFKKHIAHVRKHVADCTPKTIENI
jgi:phosphoenolpyruvate carboxykinase (ATP)